MIHSFPYYAPLALFFGLLNKVIPARYGDFLLFPFVVIPTRIEELLVLESLLLLELERLKPPGKHFRKVVKKLRIT